MFTYIKTIGITVFFLLGLFSFAFCEEETFTITTYYPSPYGSYNELTSYSNTNLAISGGNVGIGTTAPSSQLTVYGNAGTSTPVLGAGTILAMDPTDLVGSGGAIAFSGVVRAYFSGIKGYLTNGDANTTGDLAFYTRNAVTDANLTERMRILAGGNVGIGTATPGARFHVYEPNNSPAQMTVEAGNTGNAAFYLAQAADGSQIRLQADNGNGMVATMTNVPMIFQINAVEKMRLDTSGNVGIGTPSPGTKLQISVPSGAPGISVYDSTNANIAFQGGVLTPSGGYLRLNTASGDTRVSLEVSSSYGGQLVLANNPAADVFTVLSASGNSYINGGKVGIGTVDPGSKLTVAGGDVSIFAPNDGSGIGGRLLINSCNNDINCEGNRGNAEVQLNDSVTNNIWIIGNDGRFGSGGQTNPAFTLIHYNGSAWTVPFVIDGSNDNVGISTLSTNGSVYSNGTYLTNTNPSSREYKENIKAVYLQPARLLKLEPKSFTWKSNGKQDIGYIAEEVRDILPELYQDDGTTKGYDAAKLPIYLIELIKRQQKQLDGLKSELKDLKAKLNIIK